ncbi:glycosyltransferase 87 family protein [Kitasatospora arboriphila]
MPDPLGPQPPRQPRHGRRRTAAPPPQGRRHRHRRRHQAHPRPLRRLPDDHRPRPGLPHRRLTFLGTFALGALLLPDATWGFWTKYLYDSSRVGKTEIVDNQSVRGAVARLLHTADPGTLATLAGATVAVAGLATAAWAHRSARWLPRGEAWGICCAAVTAVLISPISWTHHWVWCVPVLVLLAAEAAHERSRPVAVRRLRWRPIFGATLLAFLSFAMWVVPHKGDLDQHLAPLAQIPAAVYPLVGVGFLAAAAARVAARRRAAGEPLLRLPEQRPGSWADGRRSEGRVRA